MYDKKLLIIYILEILKKETDEEHHLTQTEIMRKLDSKYGQECDRRSVKNNIEALVEAGYDIVCDDGYYLAERELDDAQLRMLIDSVLFSKVIPASSAKRLLGKLSEMGSKYFKPKVSHIAVAGEVQRSDNKQVMYSVDTINDAIGRKKKISFFYNTYKKDMKLHLLSDEPFVVSPYQMVAKNRWYYLICCPDGKDIVYHFRIDRMANVIKLDDDIRPMKEVKGLEHGLNLPKHLAEHVYMYGGESIPIRFKVKEESLNHVVDWFGKDIKIVKDEDGMLTIRVICNRQAMYYWAIQYGLHVEILDPPELRKEIAEAVAKMNETYNGRI